MSLYFKTHCSFYYSTAIRLMLSVPSLGLSRDLKFKTPVVVCSMIYIKY